MTRPASGSTTAIERGGVAIGIVLGLVNALVIATGMAVASDGPRGHVNVGVGMFVFLFATIPAVSVGAILGLVAEALRKQPRWLRLPVLVIPAIGLVALLAYPFQLQHYIPVAAIPTLVAAIILERATRHREPAIVPCARIA